MENSLLAIFGEIWPMSLYYSTGTLILTKKSNLIKQTTHKMNKYIIYIISGTILHFNITVLRINRSDVHV